MSPIMVLVATRTPRLAARFGAHRVVATGMSLVALGLLMFRGLGTDTSYLYVFACIVPLTTGIAMAMSPMTASIMSAVPARRAGTGSAMNDATRELGAALGVAVLGSLAASRYAHSLNRVIDTIPTGSRSAARASLPSAIQHSKSLAGPEAAAVTSAAQHAFVDGIHFAVTVAAALAATAAVVVYRYLPHEATHETFVEPADHMAAEVEPDVTRR
jgi:Na+/melibiose symporter-like transporter